MRVDMPKFVAAFVKEWNGRKLNVNGRSINFDGHYGIQCMDLWNFWCEELSLKNWPRHNDAAGVWEDKTGAHYKYFDGILPDKPARPGDIFIYNRKAWGTGYGHIGVVIKDNGSTITVLETNGLGDGYQDQWMNQYGSAPRIHTWPKTNLYGYLRYIDGFWPNTTPAQKIPPGRYYKVRPTDTLGGIARLYKVPVQSILDLNPTINPRTKRIIAGQLVDIPDIRGWIVDPGDTLGGIAKYYGTTVLKLMVANKIINPNKLAIGQFIVVP